MQKYRLQLNVQQREAVGRISGATLLLAVPGSGKTTVVICRIAYMIRVKEIPPESILTLTFSKAGARDLSRRYLKILGKRALKACGSVPYTALLCRLSAIMNGCITAGPFRSSRIQEALSRSFFRSSLRVIRQKMILRTLYRPLPTVKICCSLRKKSGK